MRSLQLYSVLLWLSYAGTHDDPYGGNCGCVISAILVAHGGLDQHEEILWLKPFLRVPE